MNSEYPVNLGGFPPIIKVTKMISKKREFGKIDIIDKELLESINIINV